MTQADQTQENQSRAEQAPAGETPAEEILAEQSRLGDRSAFEELVRATSRTLFAYLYLETGDHQLAEDLVQEAYLSAWRNIKSLADPRAVRGWLFSIAHRQMVDSARRRSRWKRSIRDPAGNISRNSSRDIAGDSLLMIQDPAPMPDDAANAREQRGRVLAALRSMPREYRQPLTLRYLAGADYQTIGKELSITNGSLRGLLCRGMALLRERLGEPRNGDTSHEDNKPVARTVEDSANEMS